MESHKTSSLEKLEAKMADMEKDSLRYHVLESAKNFKTSWVELGRALYSVWKDKSYKEWGFINFDTYSSKEIGIRKQTALKLLRSYYFLEKEEPEYLKQETETALLPTYESVDVLRLAKNKKALDAHDYQNLKKSVFEKGKDVREVKKDLVSLMRQRQELEPEEARVKRKGAQLKRLVSVLRTLKMDIEDSRMLPVALIKDINGLLSKLENEMK